MSITPSQLTEFSGPWDGHPMYESDWSEMLDLVGSSGVYNPYIRDAEGRPVNLRVYSDNQGRQVRVLPGQAMVYGQLYRLTAEKSVTLEINNSGSVRRDLIVLRKDTVAKTITVEKRTGVAGSTAVPRPVQIRGGIWEMPLAWVSVPSGFQAVNPNDVHDQRWWLPSAAALIEWATFIPRFDQRRPGTAVLTNAQGVARYVVDGSTCIMTWSARGTIVGERDSGFWVTLPMKPAAEAYGIGNLGDDTAIVRTDPVRGQALIYINGGELAMTHAYEDVTLDAGGNGYIDFPHPYSQYVHGNIEPLDPAAGQGYHNYPQIQAMPVGGTHTRLVLTRGNTGGSFNIRATFMTPPALINGSNPTVGFTLVYPIAEQQT